MLIFLFSCASEAPQPLQLDTRPRVQISMSGPPDTPIESSYSCMLQAKQDVIISSTITGRITELHRSEGTTATNQSAVITLQSDRAQAQLSLADAGRIDAQAMLEEAQTNLNRITALGNSTATADLDRAEIAVRRADAALQGAKAQHKLAQVQLNEHIIKAPFTGEIVELFHDIGGLLPAGQPAFRIVNSSTLSTNIGVGGQQRLAMESQPAEAEIVIGQENYGASIESAPIASDLGGLSWNVELSLSRPEGVLPGTAATAILRTEAPRADARISIENLDMNGRVYELTTEGTIVPIEIEIIAEHGQHVYVNGIASDTQLVLYPNSEWATGTAVVVLESAR